MRRLFPLRFYFLASLVFASFVTSELCAAVFNTPPQFNGLVRDGLLLSGDQQVTFSSCSLSANWDTAVDPAGIASYFYAIGTAPGGTDIVDWTDNGTKTTASNSSLSLRNGTTCYFSVYAVNIAGIKSEIQSSNGLRVELRPFPGGLQPISKTDRQKAIQTSSISRVQPDKEAISRYRQAPGARYGLPSIAKNYQYLPVIRDQGAQGSCVAWSCGYYLKTYQEAREHNLTIRPDPASDPQHVASPAFIYHLVNKGADEGSEIYDAMDVLTNNGCSTWQAMPYTDSDYITWPTEEVWKNAAEFRGLSSSFIDVTKDGGIDSLKQVLANGDIAVVGFQVFSGFYFNYPGNTQGVNNGVLFADSGEQLGGHAVTVIGYDDNKAYTDNSGNPQKGAMLIVNSWGPDWGVGDPTVDADKHGLMWISYSYLKSHPDFECHTLTDRVGYTPTMFGIVGITHPSRGDLSLNFRTGFSNTSLAWHIVHQQGGAHAVDQRIAADLTDFDSDSTMPTILFQVKNDGNDSGQITYAAIEKAGGALIISTDVPKALLTPGQAYSCIFIDTTPPTVSISLSAQGSLPTGSYTLSLTASEPLVSLPALTCEFSNNTRLTLALTGAAKSWTAALPVDTVTPNGECRFVFVGNDRSGNEGTAIISGERCIVNTTLTGSVGGSCQNSDGAAVRIPPNAAGSDLTVRILTPATDDPRLIEANAVALQDTTLHMIHTVNLCRDFEAVDSNGNALHNFNRPVTITLPYPDSDQNGIVDGTTIPETSLRVGYLDETTHRWVLLAQAQVDTLNNTISATTSHFSVYTVLALTTARQLESVICYPNPCAFWRGETVHFSRISPVEKNITVRIFTISGELVRILSEGNEIVTLPTQKLATWDGKNSAGQNVASGVYLYIIKSDTNRKVGKIAVIR